MNLLAILLKNSPWNNKNLAYRGIYGVKDINKVELIINNEDNIDLNPKVEANVLINNKEISLNHHTNNFVANSVFGMISS